MPIALAPLAVWEQAMAQARNKQAEQAISAEIKARNRQNRHFLLKEKTHAHTCVEGEDPRFCLCCLCCLCLGAVSAAACA